MAEMAEDQLAGVKGRSFSRNLVVLAKFFDRYAVSIFGHLFFEEMIGRAKSFLANSGFNKMLNCGAFV